MSADLTVARIRDLLAAASQEEQPDKWYRLTDQQRGICFKGTQARLALEAAGIDLARAIIDMAECIESYAEVSGVLVWREETS